MNSPKICGNNPAASDPGYEETLRLIAHLPVPEGLVDRVHAGLHPAPQTGRLLSWPAMDLRNGWFRAAAAAAIVLVVAGGGWGIYLTVPAQPRAISAPPRLAAPGGFSSAGAMRTPQTLNGPVLTHPAPAETAAKPAEPLVIKNPILRAKAKPDGKSIAVPVKAVER